MSLKTLKLILLMSSLIKLENIKNRQCLKQKNTYNCYADIRLENKFNNFLIVIKANAK